MEKELTFNNNAGLYCMEFEKRDIWLLWHLTDNHRNILRSVDESEEIANRHRSAIMGQYVGPYSFRDGPPPRLYIEKRETNHMYGDAG